MKINLSTPGVHHLALRATDLARSRRFYADLLGFPVVIESPELFIFLAGGTAIAVRGPQAATAAGDTFDPFRVGLDHIALGCADEAELERVAAALAGARVENTGIRLDPTLQQRYVAFKDPDRIAWEFYMAPNLAVQAVKAYLTGIATKNLDAVPFADHVTFESPLAPPAIGVVAVKQQLTGMFPVVNGVRLLHHVADGDSVAARFDLDTPFGVIEVLDLFRVTAGRIAEIHPFYDPRPITSAQTASPSS